RAVVGHPVRFRWRHGWQLGIVVSFPQGRAKGDYNIKSQNETGLRQLVLPAAFGSKEHAAAGSWHVVSAPEAAGRSNNYAAAKHDKFFEAAGTERSKYEKRLMAAPAPAASRRRH
ncbi:unnamed protein product, partial [Phaeothamnion confervicola]